MSKSTATDVSIGSTVTHQNYDDAQWVVTSIARGWYTLEHDGSTIKARYSEILLDKPAAEPSAKQAPSGAHSDAKCVTRTCDCGTRVTSFPIDPDDGAAEFNCWECGNEWQESVDFDDEGSQSKLARTIAKYRHKYVPTLAASGKKSLSNGDELAMLLAGLEATQVCDLADKLLGFPLGHHLAKYSHLNKGSQRMNAGNKIRAALKRGDLAFDDKGNLTIVQHAGDDK